MYRAELDLVADRRRGAVGINVVDFRRRHAGAFDCRLHTAQRTLAVFGWRGDVISVSRETIADDLGIHLRSAAFGVLIRFEHDNSGTLAHHEAVAIAIVGTRSAFRCIIERRGKSATGHKSRHPDPRDRRFRATRHHDLGVTERHQSRGISDGMRTGRTGGDDCMVVPFEALRDRYIARCEINQTARNEERRHAAWPSFLEPDRRFSDAGEPADARTDPHPRFDLIVIAYRL